jgi:hypothetical protein
MSKTAMVFFTLLLVLACCYTAGCSLPSSSGAPSSSEKANLSSVQGNTGVPGKQSLEDAVGFIFAEWSAPENAIPLTGSTAKHIKYVHGTDLDEQGYASSWMIVVEIAGKSSMVTINNQGSTTSDASGIPTWTEINTDQIMYPRELIEKNHAVIFNASQSSTIVSRSISLEDGDYIITQSGRNGQQTLVFNATTGALTP